MNMDPIPPQMTINLSKISVNYLNNETNPISNPNYLDKIFIALTIVNPTDDPLPTDLENTATNRETWQTHFYQEQLHF
jgi:hypothetical protein